MSHRRRGFQRHAVCVRFVVCLSAYSGACECLCECVVVCVRVCVCVFVCMSMCVKGGCVYQCAFVYAFPCVCLCVFGTSSAPAGVLCVYVSVCVCVRVCLLCTSAAPVLHLCVCARVFVVSAASVLHARTACSLLFSVVHHPSERDEMIDRGQVSQHVHSNTCTVGHVSGVCLWRRQELLICVESLDIVLSTVNLTLPAVC